MELLALMQMGKWGKWLWGGRGHVDNFLQTTLASIISYLAGIVGTLSVEGASE